VRQSEALVVRPFVNYGEARARTAPVWESYRSSDHHNQAVSRLFSANRLRSQSITSLNK